MRQYTCKQRTLKWGENISSENLQAMFQGEVFILLSAEGTPYRYILCDLLGDIRERPINLTVHDLLNRLRHMAALEHALVHGTSTN